jgi:hypothetical protein
MKIDIKDEKTQLIIGGIVLGIGFLTYYHYRNKPITIGNQTIDTNPTPPQTNLDVNLVLKQGLEGAEVSELQRILINDYGQDLGSFGDNKDGIDGVFGTVTLAGLLKAKQVSEIALKDL